MEDDAILLKAEYLSHVFTIYILTKFGNTNQEEKLIFIKMYIEIQNMSAKKAHLIIHRYTM